MAKATTKKGSAGSGGTTKSRVSAVVSEAARLANDPATQKIIAAGLLTAAAAMTADAKLRRVAREAQDAAFEGAGIAAKSANLIGAAIITAATEAARRALQGESAGGGASAGEASGGTGDAGKPRQGRPPKKTAGAKAKARPRGAAGASRAKKSSSSTSSSGAAKASAAKKPRGRAAKKTPAGKGK